MHQGQASDASGAGEAWNEHAYKVLTTAAVTIILTATVVYHFFEDWSWVDSLYFSVVAVTTVGFGDLTPTTDAAKLFTVAYILIGLGIIGLYLNARVEHARRKRGERGRRRAKSAQPGEES